MFSVCLALLRRRNKHVPSIATNTPKANPPITPPTIAAVGDGCGVLDDWACEGCDDGFPNEVDAVVDAVVDVVIDVVLRRGIDDNVVNDGVYVM